MRFLKDKSSDFLFICDNCNLRITGNVFGPDPRVHLCEQCKGIGLTKLWLNFGVCVGLIKDNHKLKATNNERIIFFKEEKFYVKNINEKNCFEIIDMYSYNLIAGKWMILNDI